MLFLSTVRIAQISGSNTDPNPKIHDPENWQLLNDTTQWGAVGFDEGANTEHNGRLYFFFGDVRRQGANDPLNNSHLVAWTEEQTGTRLDQGGGGFHLQAVLQGPLFWPLEASSPVGVTLSLEPPVSAFSYGGRVYVFVGAGPAHYSGQTRRGDPAYGLYLVSTDQPDQTYAYRTEFLFNPRIGVCPADSASHTVLGYNFVLPHNTSGDGPRQFNWFRCRKCACLFHSDINRLVVLSIPLVLGGVCQAGGTHEADASAQANYRISYNRSEDTLNQGKWGRCGKCQTMFWSGYSPDQGICPATWLGTSGSLGHQPADQIEFVLPHDQPENRDHSSGWRRCKKCYGLFWDGLWSKGKCAVARDAEGNPVGHDPIGDEAGGDEYAALQNELILSQNISEDSNHQPNWHFCTRCLGLFFGGNPPGQNVCFDGNSHTIDDTLVPPLPGRIDPPVGDNFVLPQGLSEDSRHQASWHLCTKCALLFSDLYYEQWTARAKAPLTTGDPAIMVTEGQQHIFYRDTNGAIGHILWNPADSSFHFEPWSGFAHAPVNAAGDPATMVTEGQQHIFYRDTNGAIGHIFWNAADNSFHFETWSELAHAPINAAGDPATMVTGNQQHIFYRGTDGTINHIFWAPGFERPFHQDWSGLAHARVNAAGDPAIMVTEGQQHVFYRDTNGAISHIFWNAADNSFHFETWSDLAHAPVNAAGDPATMVTEGQQHVFYRDTNGAIGHIFWNAADNSFHFESWSELAYAPVNAAGDPATMVTEGQQHIFYRDTNGAIGHILWNAADNSFHFQDWTARAGARLAIGDPATMVTGIQQHIFYRAINGAIGHIFWDLSDAPTACPGGGSHSPSGDEYVLPHRIRQDLHNDRDWRFCTKCFGLVSTAAGNPFFTVDTAVVRNADFEGLPSKTGEGLVIVGYGFFDFFLAWMPLGLSGPRLQDTMYYAQPAKAPKLEIPWHPNVENAAGLFGVPDLSDTNRISLAWLEKPQRWILLYGRRESVFVRIGATLWDWSDEIPIISSSLNRAGDLYPWVKPDTWPYGPSILKRYTEWDLTTRVLGIYYLISLSGGYQVHLMYTQLKVEERPFPPRDLAEAIAHIVSDE
jgi:hypothetical protein